MLCNVLFIAELHFLIDVGFFFIAVFLYAFVS